MSVAPSRSSENGLVDEQVDTRVVSSAMPAEVKADEPFAGRVTLDDCSELVVGFDGHDERSRPFNLLRGQLVRQIVSSQLQIVGVTSATPQTGKSFVAVNLAAALSRLSDINAYLFDLDLRRSSIAKYLGMSGDRGLIDFLDGSVPTLSDLAWSIEGERLTVFPCFPKDVNSAEVLASARMDELVAAMRQFTQSLCICDLPPAFANDDTVIVSQKVDGYILVIEDGVTTAKQIRDTIRLLEPTPCIGTILNRYHGGVGGDDYGYGYGKSHAYSDYYK